MSRLFYHHVGREGSERDFPRSLGQRLAVQEIQPYLTKDLGQAEGERFVSRLRAAFPQGFNCWGLPSRARQVFDLLERDDIVLLIGKLQLQPHPDGTLLYDGAFEYAGQLQVICPDRLHETSRYVWTEPKFPLMFFFEASPIGLPWRVFLQDVGYKATWDPHGHFHPVSGQKNERLPGGDPDSYLQHIMRHYP